MSAAEAGRCWEPTDARVELPLPSVGSGVGSGELPPGECADKNGWPRVLYESDITCHSSGFQEARRRKEWG